ncbi:MAG: hypothetical protein LC753_19895 [Acidobacteria bacterium]|nr:hypothetical protein [Acidobacteriota bacterium]MCA1652423.1 hypothetical protein [Acidobacteriota bacterium]
MPHSSGQPPGRTFMLRLSVPAEDSLRAIAAEIALKVAEYVGTRADPQSLTATLEELATSVRSGGKDVIYEFRQLEGELLIEARCEGRTAQARRQIPA